MTACPEHPEVELRDEYDPETRSWTGFCMKCPKRWQICTHVHYMSRCRKVANHEGLHKGESTSWDSSRSTSN